jgi:hypothetical protein
VDFLSELIYLFDSEAFLGYSFDLAFDGRLSSGGMQSAQSGAKFMRMPIAEACASMCPYSRRDTARISPRAASR